MPSDFALELSEQLCQFLSISASEDAQVEFATAIDFHASFLAETSKDDLAPLLFLECVDEIERRKRDAEGQEFPGLRLGELRTLLSRVQKRIYRDAKGRRHRPSDLIQLQPENRPIDPMAIERVLSDFQTYLATELSPQHADIFNYRFIQGKTVPEICDEIGVEKSTVYERIRAIKAIFEAFLDDVGCPGIHER